MDFASLFNNIRQHAPEFAASNCVVNGSIMSLDEVQGMGYEEFSLFSKMIMPKRLYRYFSNRSSMDKDINHSVQALKNNTVFLQTPTAYDDVYDSDVNIDYSEYEHFRLVEYCHRCGINVEANQTTQEIGDLLVEKLWNHFSINGNLENVFTKVPDSELENLSNESFTLRILTEYYKTNDFGKATANAMQSEYSSFVSKLKTTFRTVCFSTTPYSQLMWGGAYADNHHGFCVEYTVLPNEERYKDVYLNLFPMIYCKVRPEMSSRLAATHDKELSIDDLWDIYFHGVLRKSLDWAFQNEWRLVLLPHSNNTFDYNVKFFPITKVYLGNRMPPARRKEIIDICHRKGIPYVGVKRKSEIFEMEPCEILCENCFKFTGSITPTDDNTKSGREISG